MSRWYVVHTQPRGEERAAWHLANQGFRCFLPRLRKLRRHARKSDTVLEPLFPRYMFVNFDADAARWRAINGTRGVVGLIANGPNPMPVAAGVVESLQTQCEPDGSAPLTALGVFCEGTRVRIKTGAFAGQTGQIAEIAARGADRVRVLLEFMGAQTSLQLPAYAVETA